MADAGEMSEICHRPIRCKKKLEIQTWNIFYACWCSGVSLHSFLKQILFSSFLICNVNITFGCVQFVSRKSRVYTRINIYGRTRYVKNTIIINSVCEVYTPLLKNYQEAVCIPLMMQKLNRRILLKCRIMTYFHRSVTSNLGNLLT